MIWQLNPMASLVAGSLDRSHAHCLDRLSVDRSLDRPLVRSVARSLARSVAQFPNRSPLLMPKLVNRPCRRMILYAKRARGDHKPQLVPTRMDLNKIRRKGILGEPTNARNSC